MSSRQSNWRPLNVKRWGAVQRTEATNDKYKQTMLKMGIKIIAISHQLYLCCG